MWNINLAIYIIPTSIMINSWLAMNLFGYVYTFVKKSRWFQRKQFIRLLYMTHQPLFLNPIRNLCILYNSFKRYVAFTIDETQFRTFVLFRLFSFRFSLLHIERMVLALEDDVRWGVSDVKNTDDDALSNPGSLCLTTWRYGKRRRYSVSGRHTLAAPYLRSVLCSMICRMIENIHKKVHFQSEDQYKDIVLRVK